MAPKRKSTPARNPLRSGASSSSDPSPSTVRFCDDDDGDDDDASDDDGDASSTMRCLLDTLPFVTHDKKGEVVLDMRVVTLKERVSFWDHFVSGSVIILRDVVRISCIFSFLYLLDTLFLYMRSCDHL